MQCLKGTLIGNTRLEIRAIKNCNKVITYLMDEMKKYTNKLVSYKKVTEITRTKKKRILLYFWGPLMNLSINTLSLSPTHRLDKLY